MLMKMKLNDWNRSWIHEKNKFLLGMCSTDENDESQIVFGLIKVILW